MRIRRVDANQAEITKGLRNAGAFVQPIHTVGNGCPDLLVWHRKKWFVLEVKDGSKPQSARSLTTDEALWHASAGRGAVQIIETLEEAIDLICRPYTHLPD